MISSGHPKGFGNGSKFSPPSFGLCRIISLDDLIQAKEALGREKDLLAAKELRAVREKQK